MISDSDALDRLLNASPTPLSELPQTHGLYGLRDHEGTVRYIGITPGDAKGFRGRIFHRHVTGSTGRSHKFSHAYNCGRMWSEPKGTSSDAKLAKALRSMFTRRFCSANFIEISAASVSELRALETQARHLAPAGTLLWDDQREFDPYPEPRELVDVLLREIAAPSAMIAAIERQASKDPRGS